MIRIVLWLVLLALPAAAMAQEASPMRGVALVIGESKYVRLPKLANPDTDARAIDHMLDDLGFDVTRVLDARADKLRASIESFIADAADADVAVVYYAGHGIEVGGQNFMLATDANISNADNVEKSLIAVDGLLDELQKAVPVTIVLLDACRTSPFKEGQTIQLPGSDTPMVVGVTGLAVEVRGPTPAATETPNPDSLGMVVGFSASPGQAALDGEQGSNSPYAAALLKHMVAIGYSFGDVMTLVSQEVYVQTKARQLPWTNSSLNRILYFGREPEAADVDENAILADRRKLLLSIASVPEQSREIVESVAGDENLDLAQLYSMLGIIEGGNLTGGGEDQLRDVAGQIRQILDDPLLPAVPSDPELARLDALAKKALSEGAVALSYEYRKQEAARAAEIEQDLDAQQSQIKSKRKELAGVYARVAESAIMNLDQQTAARQYRSAAKQVDVFDKTLSFKLRLRAADSFARLALTNYDGDAAETAIELYGDLLEETSKSKQPQTWAHIQLQLAQLLMNTVWNHGGGQDRMPVALEHARNSLEVYTAKKNYSHWRDALRLVSEIVRQMRYDDFGMAALQELLVGVEKKSDDWADTEARLGDLYSQLAREGLSLGATAQFDNPYGLARAAYQQALRVFVTGHNRGGWVQARIGAANAAYQVAFKAIDFEGVRAAMDEMEATVPTIRQLELPNEAWQYQAAFELMTKGGMVLKDYDLLEEALDLSVSIDDFFSLDRSLWEYSNHWSTSGDALYYIGKTKKDVARLLAAKAAFENAREGFDSQDDSSMVITTDSKIRQIDDLVSRLPPPTE